MNYYKCNILNVFDFYHCIFVQEAVFGINHGILCQSVFSCDLIAV